MDYFNNDFWGSTDLKGYFISPKYAYYQKFLAEKKNSAALDFGTKWHKFIECIIKGEKFPYNIFTPPINPTTGQPFGRETKKYIDSISQIENPISENEVKTINSMFDSIKESKEIKHWLKVGIPEPEFYDDTDKTKWKPDILTNTKIIDWKTCQELSFDSIKKAIRYNYHYDFSAAHYQKKELDRTGDLKLFFWVFIQSVPPYDYCIVEAKDFIISKEDDILLTNESSYRYSKIMDIHLNCIKSNTWEGISSYISENQFGLKHFNPVCNNLKYSI